MALIKCPECGKQISDRAAACPNCGCPVNSNNTTPQTDNNSKYAQIRVVCKTATLKIDGQRASHGNIVKVLASNGYKNIYIGSWGGATGLLGSGIHVKVLANHKYDLDVHLTFTGRMLYLKEVEQFI